MANDKKIIEENKKELLLVGQKDNIYLKSPKKTIIKDNYIVNPQNIDKYDDFIKIKELYDVEYKEKYSKIERLIRNGLIEKDGWYKINKLFDEKRKTEMYVKDHMSKNIVEYYNNIYANNPKRAKLNQDELKLKICNILQILINYIPQNNKPIWPPKSSALDYYGFSQKIIETNY